MQKAKDVQNHQPLTDSGTKRTISNDDIVQFYTSKRTVLHSLCDEINFSLKAAIDAADIRVSDISTRVKTIESVIEKIARKSYASLEQVTDLVGARIICLFRQDLESIKSIVNSVFLVEDFDDKSYSDPDAFGYMSLHFQCRLKDAYTGPRYDSIKSISFELQLRTICMHAWSAVQHALDYKGDWDVPETLKKDINALSAIFYVADTQFSAVYAARSKERISNYKSETDSLTDLNLDTIYRYAATKFPDRDFTGVSNYSLLVKELSCVGYKTIENVDTDVERAKDAFVLDEMETGNHYSAVGVIRVSVGLASKPFRDLVYPEGGGFTEEMFKLVKKA